ncbi:hypothetical protein MASR1M60_30300 [Rhodocyclaceae bacterium]
MRVSGLWSRVFFRWLGGGLVCLLMSLPLLAQSVSTEYKPPSELEKVLVDMMRRDHIDRTRSTYVSSSQWQAHCDAFYGEQDKTWCEENRQKALNGEARLQAFMKHFGLEDQARQKGWLTFYMAVGFFEDIREGSLDAAWLDVLEDLLTGYSPPGTRRCAQEYPCAVVLRIDKADLRLLDIDVIVLKQP